MNTLSLDHPRRNRARAALLIALLLPQGKLCAQVDADGFWSSRDTVIQADPRAYVPRIAIGDSGVDTTLFAPQLVRDTAGHAVLRGYDAYKRRQDEPMARMPDSLMARAGELNDLLMALDDRDSGEDSPRARALTALFAAQSPQEAAAFDDAIGRWSGYVHGTAVADIAVRGNAQARIVVARMEWWHGTPPVPCWTRELADREAASIADLLEFVVAQGARVVNMSWGRSEKAYLSNLSQCAPDIPLPERQELARYTVERIRAVLKEGMARHPQVLFVGAAGNEGTSLLDANPATRFTLPNFLMVGAADRHGEIPAWSNSGPEVALHANGDRVAARLPGGANSFPSGTSMAVPNVVNAAAKVLTVAPQLSGAELRALLERTATVNATGHRLLHTRQAMTAAMAGQK
ncbi:MAG: S8 family serine peptidase [Flavobacteriales bacterium]|nr:S8 family serine peptidase [Flavobacteriales bacterium]